MNISANMNDVTPCESNNCLDTSFDKFAAEAAVTQIFQKHAKDPQNTVAILLR